MAGWRCRVCPSPGCSTPGVSFGDPPFTIGTYDSIDHQPPGYWATNLYASPRKRPKADAPIKDLPARAAAVQAGARGHPSAPHVTEQWCSWAPPEMGVDVRGRRRKLGYLHPMETGLSGTFIVTKARARARVTDGLPRPSRQAIRDGRMAAACAGAGWSSRSGRRRRLRPDHSAEASAAGTTGMTGFSRAQHAAPLPERALCTLPRWRYIPAPANRFTTQTDTFAIECSG